VGQRVLPRTCPAREAATDLRAGRCPAAGTTGCLTLAFTAKGQRSRGAVGAARRRARTTGATRWSGTACPLTARAALRLLEFPGLRSTRVGRHVGGAGASLSPLRSSTRAPAGIRMRSRHPLAGDALVAASGARRGMQDRPLRIDRRPPAPVTPLAEPPTILIGGDRISANAIASIHAAALTDPV
jgi:hypothetical protein